MDICQREHYDVFLVVSNSLLSIINLTEYILYMCNTNIISRTYFLMINQSNTILYIVLLLYMLGCKINFAGLCYHQYIFFYVSICIPNRFPSGGYVCFCAVCLTNFHGLLNNVTSSDSYILL